MRVLSTGALGWPGRGLAETVSRVHQVRAFDVERTKRDAANRKASMEQDGWMHRYDVGEACLRALEFRRHGNDVFHLVGAPVAKRKYDVARAEAVLGLEFTPYSGRG